MANHSEQQLAVDWALSTTRTVRKRLDLTRPVEPHVIMECLRLAIQAPTGGNAQGWRWMVVTDPEKKATIGEFYRSAGRRYFAAKAGNEPDEQTQRVQDSAEYLMDVIEQVPVLVIPCIKGRPASVEQSAAFFGSIHPAIWSFSLALRARGLGSAWTSFHLAHEKETAQLLGIPDGFTQAALLPVAYTIGSDFTPAKRRPVEEITYWNEWDNTASQ